jgi:hypothetical protein
VRTLDRLGDVRPVVAEIRMYNGATRFTTSTAFVTMASVDSRRSAAPIGESDIGSQTRAGE